MADMIINDKWKTLLDNFSSYTGTITAYCKENNISKSQFYYYRKKTGRIGQGVFHAITLKERTEYRVNTEKRSDVKIETGNTKIFVPPNEIAALKTVIQELCQNV